MNDLLISMYIDDELDLDEKITFVQTIHRDGDFTRLTEELLVQEKALRQETQLPLPAAIVLPRQSLRDKLANLLNLSFGLPLASLAVTAALLCVFFFFGGQDRKQMPVGHEIAYRFVLYNPKLTKAELIGSFSNWQPLQMEKIGTSGYWAITVKLPEGEHAYSYLLDSRERITDPTVNLKEQDDFGGENSVLKLTSTI